MAFGALLTLASTVSADPTCLAGFQQFGDKCITTVNTGYGLSGGTLNMMECAENCGYLARPYVDEDPLAAARPLCIGSQAEQDFIQTSLIDEDGHAAVWLNFLRVDDDGNDWAGREATESFSAPPDAPWGKRRFLGAGGCSNEWVDAALAVDEGGLLQGGFAGNPALSVAPWADGEPYDLWGVGNEGCASRRSRPGTAGGGSTRPTRTSGGSSEGSTGRRGGTTCAATSPPTLTAAPSRRRRRRSTAAGSAARATSRTGAPTPRTRPSSPAARARWRRRRSARATTATSA